MLACGDTASYCAQIAPAGGTLAFEWTITGGTIETSPSASCVRVKAGTGGSFSLSLRLRRNNCPVDCNITVPLATPKCDILAVDATRVLACGDTASFCAQVTPPGGTLIFEWTITGGTIETSPSASCVRVKAGTTGSFTLTLTLKRNNCTLTCVRTVPYGQPLVDIVAVNPNRVLACGDTASFCAAITPPGGTQTFEWTITGGSIETSPSLSCVRVKAGAGTAFTLSLKLRRNNCLASVDKTVPFGPPKCEIVAVDPSRVLTCGDTASFCAIVTPAGGTVTFEWNISGGTIETSPSASCVRVKAGTGPTVMISLRIRRNNCPFDCTKNVPLGTATCEIVAVNAQRTVTCGDTASYCARVTPAGGVLTFEWTIVGGTIETPSLVSCVRVRAGSGPFTLQLKVKRNNCPTECERTVPLEGPTCTIAAVPATRGSVCAGDTASFCATVTPPDGITYSWSVTGGRLVTSASAACVTARADGGTVLRLTLSVTRSAQCTNTCSRDFTIAPLPTCAITGPAALLEGTRGELCGPTGNLAYRWSTNEATRCVTVGPGTYSLTITDNVTGCKSTCSFTIKTIPCACKVGYPDDSHTPRSKVEFLFQQSLKAVAPECPTQDSLLRLYYNSDNALVLGVRRVTVKTSSGSVNTDYPVSAILTPPGCVRLPQVGATATSGEQAGTDKNERPLYPALFVTDITNDPSSRAGDWQQGGVGIPPHKVCGRWKAVVRTVDKTSSPPKISIASDSNPDKNDWNLGAGSDPLPRNDLPNLGYGAEVAWNIYRLGLVPGHVYRLYFMIQKGKSTPDGAQGCVTVMIPQTVTVAAASLDWEPAVTPVPSPDVASALAAPDARAGLPVRFELMQNEPNPFRGGTIFRFALPERSVVAIRLFTIIGQEVATVVNGEAEAGYRSFEWKAVDRSGRILPPGLYLYRMEAKGLRSGTYRQARKMVLVR